MQEYLINLIQTSINAVSQFLTQIHLADPSVTAAASSFILIVAAEMGDKSQLVCMTLASKHKAIPILLGATLAFAFLNTLAVAFGLAIAEWLPKYIVASTVSVLFAGFGLNALFFNDYENTENIQEKTAHNAFFTTFLLITLAEFGDKTQLAVVALSSTNPPIAVWLGATTALMLTSALGIVVGRILMQKISLSSLHKASGYIFLILSIAAGYKAYMAFPDNWLKLGTD
ncbi:MAG: TMEM165/GDT1 family protein [Methylococcaceae bacterium]|jgi:putative Ca2+/H+ antiporter (TMEM165/GDT1 family)